MDFNKETLLEKEYQILTDDDWLVAFKPINDVVEIFIKELLIDEIKVIYNTIVKQ